MTSKKPMVFIASSSENLDVADAFNVNLDHEAEVTVWKHGFRLSSTFMQELIRHSETVDFAIFVFCPDDIVNIRDTEKRVVRDNVLFEMGLFAGSLGIDRCFMVKPRHIEMHLPTDLLGMNLADYSGDRSDNNLIAAINTPSTLIKNQIKETGVIADKKSAAPMRKRNATIHYNVNDVDLHTLATINERGMTRPEGVSTSGIVENDFSPYGPSQAALSILKLEKMGFISREVSADQHHEFFSLQLSPDGEDYLLENETRLVEKQKHSLPKTKPDDFVDVDDDIPF